MKKYICLLVLIAVLVTAIVNVVFVRKNSYEVASFNCEDYRYYIDNYPSEEVLGEVFDSKDVVEKAEKLWMEIYGKSVLKNKPYKVFFDAETNVWMVKGILKGRGVNGGVPYFIVEGKTGKVLAVWHDR